MWWSRELPQSYTESTASPKKAYVKPEPRWPQHQDYQHNSKAERHQNSNQPFATRTGRSPCYRTSKAQWLQLLVYPCSSPGLSWFSLFWEHTIPILLSTNVSGIWLFQTKGKQEDPNNVTTLKVQACKGQHSSIKDQKGFGGWQNDRPVTEVKWTGPGPFIMPPNTEYIATCNVKENCAIVDSILITERALPSSILVQPTVVLQDARLWSVSGDC